MKNSSQKKRWGKSHHWWAEEKMTRAMLWLIQCLWFLLFGSNLVKDNVCTKGIISPRLILHVCVSPLFWIPASLKWSLATGCVQAKSPTLGVTVGTLATEHRECRDPPLKPVRRHSGTAGDILPPSGCFWKKQGLLSEIPVMRQWSSNSRVTGYI